MATTIADIPVDATAWVDINTVSGIAIGTEMLIVNKSVTWCRLYEAVSAPSLSVEDGQLLTNLDMGYAVAKIPAGSLTIWALSTQSDRTLKLSVQDLT